ncbi:selenium cofactor biosynthesis protein YqeC [Sporomusa malonica]|uniref:Probable selenium-dependent hydroxylase accessory protein YqeC n=1 Tax=Sporomusa malonica TaxID=112901 RepID=A0A1W1YID7_9FIRM|nr:selenium cofactor biosynthesis protein YqeC [Sporomusa malonica]SMC35571.1 probable selenium-dependent hydroxylase accessory protein YqeC [Sporomusa malonica]
MLWDALKISQPSVVACVGAGGKTSLIQSLAAAASVRGWPALVTATTKMFYSQVDGYGLVVADEYSVGITEVANVLQTGKTAAWFAGRDGEKVLGVPLAWIDSMAADIPNACILIEADGARRSLLKAPAAHEPLIPACTTATVGVLNMGAIGQSLAETNTHRLSLVSNIIKKQAGETIEWLDLALLAAHGQGIFQYARGTKVLLLSGAADMAARLAAKQIAGYSKLAGIGIARVVVTQGYGRAMRPIEVYEL